MNKNIKVQLKTDSEHFISQECPACKKRFKIKPGSGSDLPISYCPYCGHNEQDCWWTKEQVEYFGQMAAGEIIEPELEKMAKEFNRNSPKSGFITMSMDYKKSPKVVPPEEPEEDWQKRVFKCCGETIKHDASKSELHCIICGK